MDIKKLREELNINEYDLQEEWRKQPVLFMDYSTKLSRLIHERDEYRSQLAGNIINKGEKISEAAMTRTLENDEGMIDFQLQINLYKNAVQSFEHKKKALEYEAQLLMGGFFSEPKEKKPIKKKKGD